MGRPDVWRFSDTCATLADMDTWSDLGNWWRGELEGDSAYHDVVAPLLLEALVAQAGTRYLDLGCGEGRVMRELQARGVDVVGCDLNHDLLSTAADPGPVVQCRLPDLGWARAMSFGGAYASLVFEHLVDLRRVFEEVARVMRRGGVFAAVMNHPFYTAPQSGPIVDPTDGELFWRWGDYLSGGTTSEPAGEATVAFSHRSLSKLLNTAADAGWILERMIERAVVGDDPLLAPQSEIPRLLAVRWRKP